MTKEIKADKLFQQPFGDTCTRMTRTLPMGHLFCMRLPSLRRMDV